MAKKNFPRPGHNPFLYHIYQRAHNRRKTRQVRKEKPFLEKPVLLTGFTDFFLTVPVSYLKIGKLTHQDIGQMDGYVSMYEENCKVEGDNPTIGIILCSEKNESIARYSVLNESKQLFASKYVFYLPTEEELQRELERERRLVEAVIGVRD